MKINGNTVDSNILGILEKTAEITEEKDEEVQGLHSLSIKNPDGKVEIKSYDGENLKIRAVKKVRASGNHWELYSLLDEIKIDLQKSVGSVDINVEYPEEKSIFLRRNAALEIAVPKSIRYFNVETSSGDIILGNLESIENIKLKSESGDIRLSNSTSESLSLESLSGDITIVKVEGKGELRTISGNVTLRSFDGKYLKCVATSGDIDIYGFKGSLNCNTSSGKTEVKDAHIMAGTEFYSTSGNINAYIEEFDTPGEYRWISSSGDINIYLPGISEFTVDARTFSGRVKNEFTLIKDFETGKKKSNRVVNGVVGEEGASISIYADTGDIRILKATSVR